MILFEAIQSNPKISAALATFKPADINQQARVVDDLLESERRLKAELNSVNSASTGRRLFAVNGELLLPNDVFCFLTRFFAVSRSCKSCKSTKTWQGLRISCESHQALAFSCAGSVGESACASREVQAKEGIEKESASADPKETQMKKIF